MVVCCVKHCKNVKRLLPPESQITFHRIPKKDFAIYMEMLGLESTTYSVKNICSLHFNNEDFVIAKNNRRFLKKGVVPSQNLDVKNENTSDPTTPPPTNGSGPFEELIQPPEKRARRESSGSTITLPSPGKKIVESSSQVPPAQQSSSETSSLSNGSKRERRQLIKAIHSYSISPRKMRSRLEQSKKKIAKSAKMLYKQKQQIVKLKQQISSLQEIVDSLRNERMMSDNALDYLQRTSSDVPKDLFKRYCKNVEWDSITREEYPSSLKKFAVTLQFYSSKAYDYVRETFAFALPHPSTIRKWYSAVNCQPGFQNECFEVLKIQAAQKSPLCSLLFDEMAIKKKFDFDGKKVWGYIDFGVEMQDDDLEACTEALVLLIVAVNNTWKLPIAYFLIKSLSAVEKANIVKEALVRFAEINVKVASVTCDGPATHFKMFEELGCDFSDVFNIQSYFYHSITGDKVYAIFDACHMLKLLRNCLAALGILKDNSGQLIYWKFIEMLHELQDKAQLRAGNKLRKAHIEWQRQKMKVSLAAQTLSASVADTLEFLREDIKDVDFALSHATEEFIRRINNLFDILNSCHPFAKGYKSPMRLTNQWIWRDYLKETAHYLLTLTTVDGKPLWKTSRKTAFLGFAITITSVLGIFDDYVQSGQLNYLLTYKFSQDHLEQFFCCIRSRNGWNNNPTAMQFMYSFRRLLLHARVEGKGGNCRVLDNTLLLNIDGTAEEIYNPDTTVNRLCDLTINEIEDHDYNILNANISLDIFEENVIAYISGYVVKMVSRYLHCVTCLDALYSADTSESATYHLLRRKNKGGLIIPSEGVINICMQCEKNIRKILVFHHNSIPRDTNLLNQIVVLTCQQLYFKISNFFPDLKDHFNEGTVLESHPVILCRYIVTSFYKLRLHSLCKYQTEKSVTADIRRQYTKLILFNHQ